MMVLIEEALSIFLALSLRELACRELAMMNQSQSPFQLSQISDFRTPCILDIEAKVEFHLVWHDTLGSCSMWMHEWYGMHPPIRLSEIMRLQCCGPVNYADIVYPFPPWKQPVISRPPYQDAGRRRSSKSSLTCSFLFPLSYSQWDPGGATVFPLLRSFART